MKLVATNLFTSLTLSSKYHGNILDIPFEFFDKIGDNLFQIQENFIRVSRYLYFFQSIISRIFIQYISIVKKIYLTM